MCQGTTYRAQGRGRTRTVLVTRARDRDPRGPTDSCTADAWRTVSSAVLHPSPAAVPSSSSLENFARDQRMAWVGRQDAGKWITVRAEKDLPLPFHRGVGGGGQCIHLFGFRLRIGINIREARSRTSADR